MIDVRRTPEFERFMTNLRDARAKTKIVSRIGRLALGNEGDVNSVGEGISELRIHFGPGYRVYFKRRGPLLIILLCGGDKKTQDQDIKSTKKIAGAMEN